MTSKLFVELLYSVGFISLFLLLGVFLRAKIKFFGQTFIPASVIGGFIVLILGNNGFNILKLPDEWMNIYKLLPGILIVPVVASVPLGLRFEGSLKSSKNILPLAFIIIAISMFQFAAGLSTQYVFTDNFYSTFGLELGIGYVGGHGTAAVLGNLLHNLNLEYWEQAQGVAITMATFGLVGGILFGMVLINYASRKNETKILKTPQDIPVSFKVGYHNDINKQNSLGRETTMSSSIDALAFHLAIILGVCAISYFVLNTIKEYKIPVLSEISIWAYAIIIMFIVWGLIIKLKLSFLIDEKVKSKISGSLTEFAVVCAIASLPIKAVFEYLMPILYMVIVGFILTTIFLYFMCKWLLDGYWFEMMIATYGSCCGVFLTGILLLRICDPEFKSPAISNYSLSYTISSVTYFALLNFIVTTIVFSGLFSGMLLSMGIGLLATILAILFAKIKIKGV